MKDDNVERGMKGREKEVKKSENEEIWKFTANPTHTNPSTELGRRLGFELAKWRTQNVGSGESQAETGEILKNQSTQLIQWLQGYYRLLKSISVTQFSGR